MLRFEHPIYTRTLGQDQVACIFQRFVFPPDVIRVVQLYLERGEVGLAQYLELVFPGFHARCYEAERYIFLNVFEQVRKSVRTFL